MAEEVKAAVAESEGKNFIDAFIEEDIAEGGRFQGQQVHTRFPPEPNGYLHIGHCKALTIDFGTAERFGGLCNLRMDDTNPTKEDVEFVDAIKEDIHWLGFDWGDRFFYGSDYFEKDYEFAVELIKKGLAYVCDLTPEEAKEYRGDIGKPAVSPYRDRDVEENLDLFERMKNGEFPEGSRTLRAKIDLASGNFNMRDPVIYRIRYMHHHRQGDKWCIYPMYDFAHPIQDALEGITHSLCSLEFEAHRPLYDWVVNNVSVPCKPRQIEFAKMYLTNVVTGKRYIKKLVEDGIVDGWDDPRLVSIAALRRRGFTPESIKKFVDLCGVSKANSSVDYAMLEYCIREDLKLKKARTMAVLNPVKLVIDNYPEDQIEEFESPNHPQHPERGSRKLSFGKELWIERSDFAEEPPKGYRRLTLATADKPAMPGRLRHAYVVQATSVEKDADGKITAVHAEYFPETKSGTDGANSIKTKAAIHWLSVKDALPATIRLYDRLFTVPKPDAGEVDFRDLINKNSKTVMQSYVEPSLKDAKPEDRFQFERNGYYVADQKDFTPDNLVFNLAVALKDTFGK